MKSLRSILVIALVLAAISHGKEAGKDEQARQLVEAAFRLDEKKVVKLIAEGIPVNVRYGDHEADAVFQDPWDLGYPMSYSNWTPLMALCEASTFPRPARKPENTEKYLNWGAGRAGRVPEKVLEENRSRQLAIANLLIKAGADPNVDDGNGATPLYVVSSLKSTELLSLLIEHGANVNVKVGVYIDGPGAKTPLHAAVALPANLAALVQAGADVNARDTEGATPLHMAASEGELASVKMLLDSGADPHAKDGAGKTPIDRVTTNNTATGRLVRKMLQDYNKDRPAH